MLNPKSRVYLLFICVGLLNSFILSNIIHSSYFYNSYPQFDKIPASGITSPSFYNFFPNKTLILNPTFSLSVNDSESGLNIGSEEFGYTTDGSVPSYFLNPHLDYFQDGVIAQYWTKLNPSNGNFVEANGNVTISDLGTNEWEAAPALLQRISGDFSVTAKISTQLTVNLQQAGIYVFQDSGNILRFHYIQAPLVDSPKNVAMRYRTGGAGSNLIGAAITIGDVSPLWLKLERSNNIYSAYYSINGLDYFLVSSGSTSPNLSNDVQVGIYVGSGLSANFDDWSITPSIYCTGSNGTTVTEQITIEKVPFNQYHDSNNKIQIRMQDMNGNEGTSNLYTINITTDLGGPSFFNFTPNVTGDITPNVNIVTQDSQEGLFIGSEEFAYTKDGTVPLDFINPHQDDFNDGAIAAFWEITREFGNIIIENGNLTINNNQFSTIWSDDPFLSQKINGDFVVTTEIAASVAEVGNKSGIAYEDGNNIIRLMYLNTTNNNVNVTLSYSLDGGINNTIVGSIETGKIDPFWLKLEREGNTFYGYYSTNFEYGIYTKVGNISLPFQLKGRVGLFAGGGEQATFDDWEILPHISITGTNGSTIPETITVFNIPFNQIDEENNKIRFKMEDIFGNPGISTTFTINTTLGHYIYKPDLTLTVRNGRIELFDYQGTVLWYYDNFANIVADIEMLPDGNIMFVEASINGGYVRIVNFSDKTTIWEYQPSGAEELDWVHDADLLPWGDILIADTTNDISHQDEVLIVDYETQNINWTYVLDEGSYPNDVDYLPNGNIMINLRNYDQVIEVNYTASKHLSTVTYPNYVVSSIGETGNYSIMNHQHNPDRLPNGNTLVSDSENDRIVELDSNGNIVWIWGNSTVLNWPRDADRLPNGNTLIGDSYNNRIIEINTTTGEIVWEMSVGEQVYEVDRIDTTAPRSTIISPLNITYTENLIDITLSSEDPDVDAFWYRIYNDSSNSWVDGETQNWNQTIQRFLDDGNYTLYAWCNDTGYKEGSWDWMPFNDGNIQTINVTTSFQINSQLATFWNFRPNQTTDTTPTIYINVQDNKTGLKLGSEEFAYTKDGSEPILFGNPHRDTFDDNSTATFWSMMNDINGTFQEENGVLNLTDNGLHEWYNGKTDPLVFYQNLVGDFVVEIKIELNELNVGEYTGLIAYQNDTNYLTLAYYNTSDGSLNVTFNIFVGGIKNSYSINVDPLFGFLNPIWLKLSRNGNLWGGKFSPNGDTYGIYYRICDALDVPLNSKIKLGLFTANGSNALFDDWIISPYLNINGSVSPVEAKTIQLNEFKLNKYNETGNKIKFKIDNLNNLTSEGLTNTINISIYAISFRDNTLYGDDDQHIYEVDRFGDIVRFYDVSGLGVQAIADVESLPNGNILFVDMHQVGEDSAIYELNSTGHVVWSYKPTGSNKLEWTHDADRLENGNTLIADTSDSITHTDRIIEINSSGDIVWAYYPGEGSYPNDVDRLKSGNTLISLRGLDKIIEVAPNGSIVWEYGEPGNFSLLNHQHNPDRLENGNTIICDSENDRILEINSTKHIVWMYDGNGTTTLNWPRDADLLSNGNILITDSKNNRIIEINRTTGIIVWETETNSRVYEADRLTTSLPSIEILSPLENETWISQTIEVVLSSPNRYTTDLWYRLYDNTSSQWIDLQNQTSQKYQIYSNNYWNIRQKRILSDNHTYTLYAWMVANPSPIDGGDQVNGIIQTTPTKSTFQINCSYEPDSNSTYPGFTLLVDLVQPEGSIIREINSQGGIVWELYNPVGAAMDVERLANGNTLYANLHWPAVQAVHGAVIEVDPLGNRVWVLYEADDIHDVDRLPNGNTVFLHENTTFRGIIEVNPEKEIVWSWNALDISPGIAHINDVDLLSNGNYLASLRDWDMIVEINRSGQIVWSYGEVGNATLLNHQHNPDRLENGNTIISDSENNQIIEINPQGNIVWIYDGNGTTTLDWPRDADRLPNGNTLIVDSNNDRILEINYQGELLWEYETTIPYDADRLDQYAPYVLINSPSNQTLNPEVPIDLFCPERDVDTIWYNIYDNINDCWLFAINQTYVSKLNLTLHGGTYTLFAWSNDTGRAPGTMDDIHSNTQQIPSTVIFTVLDDFITSSNLTFHNPLELGDIQNFSVKLECFSSLKIVNLSINSGINQTMNFDGMYHFYNWTPSSMNLGMNIFEIYVQNGLNYTLTINESFLVSDTTPPQIFNLTFETRVQLGQFQNISFDSTDLSGIREIILRLDNGTNVTLIGNPFYSYSWIPSSHGNRSITIYLIDNMNNSRELSIFFEVIKKTNYDWIWILSLMVMGILGIILIVKLIRPTKKKEKQPLISETSIFGKGIDHTKNEIDSAKKGQLEQKRGQKELLILSTFFGLLKVIYFAEKSQIITNRLKSYAEGSNLTNLVLSNSKGTKLGAYYSTKELRELMESLISSNLNTILDEKDPILVEFQHGYFYGLSFELDNKEFSLFSIHDNPNIEKILEMITQKIKQDQCIINNEILKQCWDSADFK